MSCLKLACRNARPVRRRHRQRPPPQPERLRRFAVEIGAQHAQQRRALLVDHGIEEGFDPIVAVHTCMHGKNCSGGVAGVSYVVCRQSAALERHGVVGMPP